MKTFFVSKRVGIVFVVVAGLAPLGCSSDDSSTNDGGSDASGACTSPGAATQGPADDHCQGTTPQPVNPASCMPDAGTDDAGSGDDAGPADTCDYGDTMFGHEGDDDDCKYHVTWSSDPICEGSVKCTVNVTNLTDGTPVTGIPQGVIIEQFIPTVGDAACDDKTTHPGPNIGAFLVESPAGSGTYVGPVAFDAPGDWTLRFHIHEECDDSLDDSPHGHAAFHITVP